MNADGTNPVNLTNDGSQEEYPAWSPDGSKIAFQSDRDGKVDVHVMDLDGSNRTNRANRGYRPNRADGCDRPDGASRTYRTHRTHGLAGNVRRHYIPIPIQDYDFWRPGCRQCRRQ